MTHSTDDLHMIGAALAAAGDGESVDLTDQQREVLARATVPDTLDAILAHATIPPPDDNSADKIATAWSDELRAAFRLQSIVNEIAENDSIETIRSIISQDDRLSTDESQVLILGLRNRLERFLDDISQDDRLSTEKLQVLTTALRNSERQFPDDRSTSTQVATLPQPRVYLASISVEGFRGIGPRTDLRLEPQLGLTLIYGANGSGKSTFVEALDVLLTGSTARFAGRGREWRSAWANAHSPNRGRIAAEFVVEDRDARRDTIQRDWTSADLTTASGEKDDSLWEAVQTIGDRDVADATDRFRPILGYGELGPLFEESEPLDDLKSPETYGVTQFAQHIRSRASIRDEMTDALWEFITDPQHRNGFYDELSAWSWITRNVPDETRVPSVVGDLAADTVLRSPADWKWATFTTEYENVTGSDNEISRKSLFDVARAYLPQFADQIRKSITQSYVKARIQEDGEELGVYLSKRFFAYSPRARVYAEMLLNEIYSARLEQFSQRASNFWQKIRRSSDVRFEKLSLGQHRQTTMYGTMPRLRVSLGLTIDDLAIERGALSQGELHSLALSVFLPTLMNPGSPFGFAVIDDPVQVMDEHAVDGLAEVLRDAAEELQVIVFTHDERLPRALRLLDIEHTLINITRSAGSVVQCEVALDSVIRALEDAQIEAREAGEDDSDNSWMDVGVHCREAVEQACIKAAEQRLRKADVSPSDIQRELDYAVYNERLSTRKLMALAIWGDPDDLNKVAPHVTQHEKGGAWINDAIDHANALFHRNREQVPAIRSVYDNDLDTLVEVTRNVVKWIEENCG